MIFVKYFQWTLLSAAIFGKRKGADDKNKCILTIIICFIYSIYNATIRSKRVIDPFDMLFPQVTIYERNDILLEFLPIQLVIARLWFGLFSRTPTAD